MNQTQFARSVPILWKSRQAMYRKVLKRGVGAEIGVFNGDNAQELLKYASKLFLIDRWIMQKAPEALVKEHDERYANVLRRFEREIADGTVSILKMSSEDASYEFKEQSLDWVFIDGNHAFPAALWDLQLYAPLVKVGGIIMLHDFTIKISRGAVIEAVRYHIETVGGVRVVGKTEENDRKLLKHPTVCLVKEKHIPFYKKWW